MSTANLTPVEIAMRDRTLARVDLVIVVAMFIDIFGRQPLLKHRDFGHKEFSSPNDLDTWDLALALRIVLDATAVCPDANERLMRLKQRLRELLGDTDTPTLVYFQGYPFVV